MDFNLSSICDMLAERLEEYKSTSKKRRVKRERTASKAKIAKFPHEHQAKNDTRMYASTPIETPKTETQQFSTLHMVSSISKLPTPGKNQYTEKRKLTFDEEDYTEGDEESQMEESPASFPSVTKTSLETLKRRFFQRKNVKVRKLFADEDDSNDECSSKNSANKEHETNECLSKDSVNHIESKNDECLSRDSPSEIDLNNVLTPLCTPKRHRLSRKCIKARRLTFDDEENEDSGEFDSMSNGGPGIEEKFSQNKSPQEILKGQYLAESMSNDCVESTLILDSQEMDFSTIMVLNVGILIRPIRDILEDK